MTVTVLCVCVHLMGGGGLSECCGGLWWLWWTVWWLWWTVWWLWWISEGSRMVPAVCVQKTLRHSRWHEINVNGQQTDISIDLINNRYYLKYLNSLSSVSHISLPLSPCVSCSPVHWVREGRASCQLIFRLVQWHTHTHTLVHVWGCAALDWSWKGLFDFFPFQ